jgi:hypothetical protein
MNLGEQFTVEPTDPGVSQMIKSGYDISKGMHGTVMHEEGSESGGFGTHVLSASARGSAPLYELTRRDRAYYTAHHPSPSGHWNEAETSAWNWASMAVEQHKGRAKVQPRAIVHSVEPEGRLGTDPVVNRQGTTGSEMTAGRLRITGTHWIPKPRPESRGYQGTLPYVNWNQFKEHTSTSDANFENLDVTAAKQKRQRLTEENAAMVEHHTRKQKVRQSMGRMF